MKTQLQTSHVEEFVCHTLSNSQISLSLIPELGGRVVSIFDKVSGREWLDGWTPESERRLGHPTDSASYDSGSGAGLDECLPTVLPCRVGESDLQDHGELWCSAPEFEACNGELTCRWRLESLPLTFQRSIALEDDTITMRYRLENLANNPTPFQWAWHALFRLEEGDVMEFASAPRSCTTPEGETLPWPESLPGQDLSRGNIGRADPPAAKVFLGPLAEGSAFLQGRTSALELSWPGELFPWAGIWMTRGAWKGLHHWAIEPTNGPFDRLCELAPNELSLLKALETRDWEVKIRLK